MPPPLDLTGQTFNYLTALRPSQEVRKKGNRYWECLCKCGKTTVVQASALKRGEVKSCGCLIIEKRKAAATHGMSKTPEYFVWLSMRQRCNNPKSHKYYLYGEKGVRVCERWDNSFEAFMEDMGPRPEGATSIERLDGTKDYSPDNCVWADALTQANNTLLNRPLTFRGVTQNLSQWSRELGIPVSTLINRLDHRNLSVEQAFTFQPFQRAP